MKKEIQEIAKEEMQVMNMNDRQFAEYLAESMSQESDVTLSHATVINWRKHGKPPSTEFLEDLLAVYPVSDRRFLFALKMLAIKSPHVWGADGIVWSLKKMSLPKAD